MGKSTGTKSHIEETAQPANEKRNAIVREAFNVFYKEGFHAAGVDRALEGTGISKRTLYKYFASKEDLIEATIAHYSARQSQIFTDYFSKVRARNPVERALSIFDWLAERVESGNSFGCFATNAKVEYARKNPGIEAACDLHFARFENLCFQLCSDCGVKNTKKTANQFRVVFQGAFLGSQTSGNAAVVHTAKSVARLVLENAM